MLKAFVALALAQLLLVFIQLAVGGFYAHMLTSKRNILSRKLPDPSVDEGAFNDDERKPPQLHIPLLTEPVCVELNPLTAFRQPDCITPK